MDYFFARYARIVRILVFPNFFNSSKSLSPVMRCDALPSLESANRKLSLGSRHMSTEVIVSINIALLLIDKSRFCKSSVPKYFLNFCLFATVINSSISSWLYRRMRRSPENILSNAEMFLVIRKLSHRLVSIMILSLCFGITLRSCRFNFFCDYCK